MTYTPVSFSAGEKANAAKLNQLMDNIKYLKKVAEGDISAGKRVLANMTFFPITCRISDPTSGTVTGTITGLCATLAQGLCVVAWAGDTGYNDAGSDARPLYYALPDGILAYVYGYIIQDRYHGDRTAYQTYTEMLSETSYQTIMQKSDSTQRLRKSSGIIVGVPYPA